jgi:hypothetical protein
MSTRDFPIEYPYITLHTPFCPKLKHKKIQKIYNNEY